MQRTRAEHAKERNERTNERVARLVREGERVGSLSLW